MTNNAPSESVPGAAQAAAPSVPEQKKKRILLIEDDPRMRLTLWDKLRLAGFEVDAAPNGTLALDKLRSFKPDAIFITVMVAGIKEVDVLREARKSKEFAHLPIYICTSTALVKSWRKQARKAGPMTVFDKSATSADEIIRQVAAEMLALNAGSTAAPGFAAPGKTDTTVNPATAQVSTKQSSGLLKWFGFGKKPGTAPASAKATSNPPAPPANTEAPPPSQAPASPPPPPPGNTQLLHNTASPSEPAPAGQTQPGTGFIPAPAPPNSVGVLTLDALGKILSADGPSTIMFGWQSQELVGKPLSLLVREGTEDALAAFIQQGRGADASTQLSTINVVARRKDGVEFPASITRLSWSSDTALVSRTGGSQSSWTAVFRKLTPGQGRIPVTLAPPAAPAVPRADTELQKRIEALVTEAAINREALKKAEKERDELAAQLNSRQVPMDRAREALEKEIAQRKTLERQFHEITATNAELQRKVTDDTRAREELARVCDRLRKQLEESQATLAQMQEARQQETARAQTLEGELANVRRDHEQLAGRLTAEQDVSAAFRHRADDLERRLRDTMNEVARAQSEAAEQARQRQKLEVDLREQINATNLRLKHLESGWQEEAVRSRDHEARLRQLFGHLGLEQLERCGQLNKELTGARQARDEIKLTLAKEQHTAEESDRRVEEFESGLRAGGPEVQRLQASLQRAAAERDRLEREWREHLGRAERLAAQVDAARTSSTPEDEAFEQESARLNRVRDDVNAALVPEQRVAAESSRKIEEINRSLQENAEELERLKAGLAKANQNKLFESELTAVYEARDRLTAKLNAEQQAAERARKRIEELESRLRHATAELNRLRSERDRQSETQARADAQLREQLVEARRAAQTAEIGLKVKSDECKQFEKELSALQTRRAELSEKLAAAQETAARARQRALELEGHFRERKAEVERLEAEHSRQQNLLEAELQGKLAAFATAHEHAEASARQFEEMKTRLAAEEKAAAESKLRNKDLEKRLRESNVELERLKGQREKSAEQDSAEAKLREELTAAQSSAEQARAALEEKSAALTHLEQETANLRQERHQLCEKFTTEKQAGTRAKRRIKELEKQLREIAAAFNTTKQELERRVSTRSRQDSKLQAELEAAQAAVAQAEAARDEQTARCTLLERELAQAREGLSAELSAARQRADEQIDRIDELEARLRETAAELARARAAAESRPPQPQVAAAGSALGEDAEQLVREMCRLRENEAAHRAEVFELERRVRDGVASLARVTSDLEKERGERHRIEQRLSALSAQLEQRHEELRQQLESERAGHNRVSELEQQLRQREQALARAAADLRKEAADRELAEEQLRAVGDMGAQLRQYLTLFEESKKVFKKTQEQLESRLQASLNSYKETEARLQKEVSERQRLEEELAAAQRNLQNRTDEVSLEVARLQAELQVEQFERKRMEGDAQQSRFASLDSARVARTMINSFRRQLRDPVEHLMQSTRKLLESDLPADKKKIVEVLLENALLLQTSLQESTSAAGGGEGESETRAAA